MLRKNRNIFIIIGGGVIYDKYSIHRDKIYAHSSGNCKSIGRKCSYGLQAYKFR